ncbi:putative flavin carrier protein 3 [Conoideocrella luteorostrata]|uniref:Flavin carrier protein 3 n=1 Tax=Conoideocrella luteorostrata TaxID=1105319 RepID=A0AAJ0CZ57_9HYPO|nr:putative flavin carrier protein 3 [Conoideocrella luteorostrata]
MRFFRTVATVLSLAIQPAVGLQKLESAALSSCQPNSRFSASLFKVVFTPNNNSASFHVVAASTVENYVTFDVRVFAYGYQILNKVLDPCKLDIGLCPMQASRFTNKFNQKIDPSVLKDLPGIAYTVPDLDASVRVFINVTGTTESIACLEAKISNGKTVDQVGVKWATAIIAGLALTLSAVVNFLGQFNAAAHLAANALSLFGYFQSQAALGFLAVHLPPIVQSWTQNFQWSMGIVRVGFLQTLATWYQRATGGTPGTVLESLSTISVSVQKRSLQFKREEEDPGVHVVRGIERVAFLSDIESTNLFLTAVIFFMLFVVATVLAVAAFRGICQLVIKKGVMRGAVTSDRITDFRKEWRITLKGILYRVALIGFPQMTILAFWEFTRIDSAAEVALAVLFLVGLTGVLAWGSGMVIRTAQLSVNLYRNPAYILYSDSRALSKWGFLYIQFRASAYYYIVPCLVYIMVKSLFIAFGQQNGTVQSVALLVIDALALIAASVMRPWMDKPTNSFNIAIYVVNFLNAIFIFIFTNVLDVPGIVVGVFGVVLFVLNAVFACVLLIMVCVSTTLIVLRKNPDARYRFMADDRASFMKSDVHLDNVNQLDALAATARGDSSQTSLQLRDNGPHPFNTPSVPFLHKGGTQSLNSSQSALSMAQVQRGSGIRQEEHGSNTPTFGDSRHFHDSR